ETFKSLLVSLCISDRGVGFLIQPLYVAYLTMEITKNTYAIPHSLLVFASFFGVFAITVDRFLAIHLHNLRYPKLVTHKRVVAVVISFWVFSVIACFWYESISVFLVMSVVCIITTGLLYCKICAAVRHHTTRFALSNSEWRHGKYNAARLRKTAVATFYMYILFFFSAAPFLYISLTLFCTTTISITIIKHWFNEHNLISIASVKSRHCSSTLQRQKIYKSSALPKPISLSFLHKIEHGAVTRSNSHPQFSRSPLVTPGTMIPLLARTQARLTNYCAGLCFKSLASNFFYGEQVPSFMSRDSFVTVTKTEGRYQSFAPVCLMTRHLMKLVFRPLFMASAEDLNFTFVVINCFFNAFLSFTAIVLNIITMQALRKTSSLPKTLKTLLLSLAVSDLGIGLLVQPLYVAILVMKIKQNTNSTAYDTVNEAYLIQGKTLASASHFGVLALAVDRFLAIYLHLRYQELVTHKRVVAVVISVWVFSASISVLHQLYDYDIMPAVIVVVCVVTTGLLYCKIYASVRHHANQIHALQVQQATQNEDMANAARLKKSSLATFYVYLVYLVCYLPLSCVVFAAKTNGETPLLSHLSYLTFTLVYLNSSLNPLIYCWKMRHIRQTVMDILRNIFAIGPH
ncbi:unnamed protein product, partial [Porites lobata]